MHGRARSAQTALVTPEQMNSPFPPRPRIKTRTHQIAPPHPPTHWER